MARLWKPSLFFVLVLSLALLINMPTAFLLGFVRLPDNLRVFQPRGSLISGHLNGFELNQFLIRDLEYQLELGCFITLSLCYRVENPYGSLQAKYQFLSRSTELTKVDIEFPLQDFNQQSNNLLMQPGGKLQLNLDRVLIDRDKLADLNGVLVWIEAGLADQDIDLGDYEASVTKSAERYDLVIADQDAVLDITGNGSLEADGKYTLDVSIRTKSGLDSRIKIALELVAKKQGINQYVVRRTGILDPSLMSKLSF